MNQPVPTLRSMQHSSAGEIPSHDDLSIIPDDPADLCLVLPALEEWNAPERDLSELPRDTEPFGPAAEEERFGRIAHQVRFETYGGPITHWVFSEPVFTALPTKERAEWWLERLSAPGNTRSTSRTLMAILSGLVKGMDGKAKIEVYEAFRSLIWTRVTRVLMDDSQVAELSKLLPPGAVEEWDDDRFSIMVAAYIGDRDDEIDAHLDKMLEGPSETGDEYTPLMLGPLASSPEKRAAVASHLGEKLLESNDVLPWLALTGVHGLPTLLRSIRNGKGRGSTEGLLKPATLFLHTPAAAPVFVDCLDRPASDVAAEWIRTHAAAVLAADLDREQARRLRPFLRGYGDEVLRAAKTNDAMATVIDEVLAEQDLPVLEADWWADVAPEAEALPEWLTAGSLCPIIDGHRLSPEQTAQLLTALQTAQPSPLTDAIKQHATDDERDDFAVALFDLWLANGAIHKQGWCMTGAGLIGSSGFVRRLTPLIRLWPGMAQHKRAVEGLTALRNVGTHEALGAIAGIANKSTFAAIKKRAGEAMEEIAAEIGLSRGQLEDRVIPDGGFDERGRILLDYGPRRFVATLTPEAKVVAREADDNGNPVGKSKATLPKPGKNDDQELAEASRKRFSAVKKDVGAIAKIQASRFEQAMLNGRRWSAEEFTTYVQPQPLLRGLLAGVIWGVYDGQDLVGTFRIDEDGTLVNHDDETVELDGREVGILHPIELDEDALAKETSALADFELAPPFRQLDRPVFTLPEDQGDDVELHDLPGDIDPRKLVGTFAKFGWERGDAFDNGEYRLHAWYFQPSDQTVAIVYTGVAHGALEYAEPQQIEHVMLLTGQVAASKLGWGEREAFDQFHPVPWAQAPARMISEVRALLADLGA